MGVRGEGDGKLSSFPLEVLIASNRSRRELTEPTLVPMLWEVWLDSRKDMASVLADRTAFRDGWKAGRKWDTKYVCTRSI